MISDYRQGTGGQKLAPIIGRAVNQILEHVRQKNLDKKRDLLGHVIDLKRHVIDLERFVIGGVRSFSNHSDRADETCA